jgi:opacity protein-like surface antigen
LGAEVEFTHAKAIATTGSSDLTAFQQSHGLNLIFLNAAYRLPPACGGRCVVGVRAGSGLAVPHVESTFRGAHREQYQFGGMAWQVGAGVEVRLWGPLYGLAEARLTRVQEEHLRAAGAELSGAFSTRHVTFGVGWRMP